MLKIQKRQINVLTDIAKKELPIKVVKFFKVLSFTSDISLKISPHHLVTSIWTAINPITATSYPTS